MVRFRRVRGLRRESQSARRVFFHRFRWKQFHPQPRAGPLGDCLFRLSHERRPQPIRKARPWNRFQKRVGFGNILQLHGDTVVSRQC